jgi:hypothetical protein
LDPATLSLALAILDAAPKALALVQAARSTASETDLTKIDAAIAANKAAALADVALADQALDDAAKR